MKICILICALTPFIGFASVSASVAFPSANVVKHVQCNPRGAAVPIVLLSKTGVVSAAFSLNKDYIYVLESTISPLNTSRSAYGEKILKKIDLESGNVVNTLNLGTVSPTQSISPTVAGAMALSPDGSTLYVSNNQKWISVINTKSWREERKFDILPIRPLQLRLSSNGKTLFARSILIPDYGFALSAFSTDNGRRKWIEPGGDGHLNYISMSYWPARAKLLSVVVGTGIVGALAGTGGIRLVDPRTGKLGRWLASGSYGDAIAGRDGAVFATRFTGKTDKYFSIMEINKIDAKTGAILKSIGGIREPGPLVYDAKTDTLYVDYSSSNAKNTIVAAYDTASMQRRSLATCNISLDRQPMVVANQRKGVYLIGSHWLWFFPTNRNGAFRE